MIAAIWAGVSVGLINAGIQYFVFDRLRRIESKVDGHAERIANIEGRLTAREA